MESVLLKANLVNLSTGQYWLKIDEEKGMSDHEGHGHKAVLYKSHFPPLRHSLLERHHCIHRLINHVYTKTKHSIVIIAPRQSSCVMPEYVQPPCTPLHPSMPPYMVHPYFLAFFVCTCMHTCMHALSPGMFCVHLHINPNDLVTST